MTATQPMSDAERKELRKHLTQWQVPSMQADDILRHAVFGPGAVALQSDQLDPGIGIMVDETRDPKLARLFDWRARLGDEQFESQWQTGRGRAHVVLCPHGREAIYGYTVEFRRPVKLKRTYLLLVSKQAPILACLRQLGTMVWLVPQAVAYKEWAKEGASTAHDLLSRVLPVGRVEARLRGLDAALEHVGYQAA